MLDLDDFCDEVISDTVNIYRTESFIVKQRIRFSSDTSTYIMRTLSEDTYYLRTPEMDRLYEEAFAFRGKSINGKRIKTSMYIRNYVDFEALKVD